MPGVHAVNYPAVLAAQAAFRPPAAASIRHRTSSSIPAPSTVPNPAIWGTPAPLGIRDQDGPVQVCG
jgi:hypothetical protein